MKADPIWGKTLQWTFTDGPMAGKTFEHTFAADGSLTFRALDAEGEGKPTRVAKYETASLGADVHAVSYVGPSGYALTVVLDDRSSTLVAFASNDKGVVAQRGSFHPVAGAKTTGPQPRASSHAGRHGASS